MVAQIIRHPSHANVPIEKLTRGEFDLERLGSLWSESLKKAYEILLRDHGRERYALCDVIDRLYENSQFDPNSFPVKSGPISEILFTQISAQSYGGIGNWSIQTRSNPCPHFTAVHKSTQIKRICFVEATNCSGLDSINWATERVILSNLRRIEKGVITLEHYPAARQEILDQLEFTVLNGRPEKSIHKKARRWIEEHSTISLELAVKERIS
jgi:hypothetical protein